MDELARRVLASLPDVAVAVLDPSGVIVSWNGAAEALTGVASDDAVGRDFAWLHGAGAPGAPAPETLLAEAADEPGRYAASRVRADGTPYRCVATLFAVRDDAGALVALAEVARDEAAGVTDLLRESERRLADAEALAQIGSWDYDLRTGLAHWSPGMLAMHDMTAEDLEQRVNAFYDVLHPDDREWVEPIIEDAASVGGRFEFECRVVLRDCDVRRMQVVGEVFADDAGEPARMAGITRDVTHHRADEETLRRAASSLARTAVEVQRVAFRDLTRGDDLRTRMTPRQFEILGLMAEGLADAQIAERLGMPVDGVRWHERRILSALGVTTREQAVTQYAVDVPLA